MPQDWRPGLNQADVVSCELRNKRANSQQYAAIMRDGSEYWLDRVTTMLKGGLRNGEALLWWRGDQALVGAYEYLIKRVTSKSKCQGESIESKVLDWGHEKLAESIPFDLFDSNAKLTIEVSHDSLIKALHLSRMRFKDTSDKACQIGTRIHQLIEEFLAEGSFTYHDHLTGEVLERDITQEEPEVQKGLQAFLDFYRDQGPFTEIRSEIYLWDMSLGIGGKTDSLWVDSQGNRKVVDWKSSKSLYEEHLLQLAGYAGMAQKCGYGLPLSGDVVRLDKMTGRVTICPAFRNRDEFMFLWKRFRWAVTMSRFFTWGEKFLKPYAPPKKGSR